MRRLQKLFARPSVFNSRLTKWTKPSIMVPSRTSRQQQHVFIILGSSLESTKILLAFIFLWVFTKTQIHLWANKIWRTFTEQTTDMMSRVGACCMMGFLLAIYYKHGGWKAFCSRSNFWNFLDISRVSGWIFTNSRMESYQYWLVPAGIFCCRN